MVSRWSLSDGLSPQVSRTLLPFLANVYNGAVLMVSTRPLISKSSSPFIHPLVIVPRAPITIGITVTYMFHSFFQFPSKVRLLILRFAFFHYYYYYYYYYTLEPFTSTLADGFLQEFE